MRSQAQQDNTVFAWTTYRSRERNPQVPICRTRGFEIANGALTKLNVPGATSTAMFGIYHGFIWYHQKVIETIDFPNDTGFCGSDAGWTVPMGISKGGTVAGTIWYAYDGLPSGSGG